jgi:hypothetical protein
MCINYKINHRYGRHGVVASAGMAHAEAADTVETDGMAAAVMTAASTASTATMAGIHVGGLADQWICMSHT